MNHNEITKIAQFCAQALDGLEEEFPNCTFDNVVLVAAIRDREAGITTIRYASTDERVYVTRGILEEAVDAARFSHNADE